MTDYGASLLRENTGTTGLEKTARAVAETLAHFAVPHLIVGGLAVQEHGYPRLTLDVDIVVPDVPDAVEYLTANLTGPFFRVPGVQDRVEDRQTGVFVDVLPAGRVLRRGCKVPFPDPGPVTDKPKFAAIEQLISLKLDSWSDAPLRRLRDKSDVVELITRRKLARELAVAPAVRALYQETWDALQAESSAEEEAQ
jgi:hypothetical protein